MISWTCALRNAVDCAETTVSTYGSIEIPVWKRRKKKKEMNDLAVLTNSSLVRTSAMVASDFDDLGGYRTLEYESQVPTEPYNCCFSRVSRLPFVLLHMAYLYVSLHTDSLVPKLYHVQAE